MPNRLNSNKPIILNFKSFHLEVLSPISNKYVKIYHLLSKLLSPSQCPTYFPEETYVDLDITIPLEFVVSLNALYKELIHLKFVKRYYFTHLLQCWFRLRKSI